MEVPESKEVKTGLGRLLRLGRRRSMAVDKKKVSQALEAEAEVGGGPVAAVARPEQRVRASTVGSIKRRSRAPHELGSSLSASQTDLTSTDTIDNYEKHPSRIAELPRALRDLLKDSKLDTDELDAHFSCVIDVLRVVAPRELRHFSFLRTGSKHGDEEPEGSPPDVAWETEETERALRRKLHVREELGQGAYGTVYAARLKVGFHF